MKIGEPITVKVFKYNPATDKEPHYESYQVPYQREMRVLDTLVYIQEVLGHSIAFRWTCGTKKCGSCGMLVNGIPKLSCWEPVDEPVMTLEPLPQFPVIRDLVVDREEYQGVVWDLKPNLMRQQKPATFPEALSHDDFEVIYPLFDCLECNVCVSACQSYGTESGTFAGPQALVQLARVACDPRDKKRAEVMPKRSIFDCVACYRCNTLCPAEIEIVERAIEPIKTELVNGGKIPPKVRDYFKAIAVHGNPYRLPREERGKWAVGTGLREFSGQEYLYYVGCVGSHDEVGQKMARSVGTLLSEMGISLGILGSEETSDGNEVKNLGETGLFMKLAEDCIQDLKKRGVNKIITLDPHALNVFKKEYPKLGGNFQVFHYSEILAQLMKQRSIPPSDHRVKVTYHDPCYLGRHNGTYASPREVLQNISGLELVEMRRNRAAAFCCGGGGGNFFTDMVGGGKNSPIRMRLREAFETGAQIIAVACPSCAKMLSDAVKAEEQDGKLEVMGLAEIVQQARR